MKMIEVNKKIKIKMNLAIKCSMVKNIQKKDLITSSGVTRSQFKIIKFNKKGINHRTMDIFQMIGDFLHLLAMLMLVLKILANKNVIGTSPLTQASHIAPNNYFSSSSSPATSISSLSGEASISLS